MHLDGRRVEAGKLEEVSQEQGELAIKHGWAVEAEGFVDFAQGAKDARLASAAKKPKAKTGK